MCDKCKEMQETIKNLEAVIGKKDEALNIAFKHHTEPAGMNADIASKKEKLAEFLAGCDASEQAMLATVKLALSLKAGDSKHKMEDKGRVARDAIATYSASTGSVKDEKEPE